MFAEPKLQKIRAINSKLETLTRCYIFILDSRKTKSVPHLTINHKVSNMITKYKRLLLTKP